MISGSIPVNTFGDVNGDGIADVVVADQTHQAAAVLLADGRGGLALAGPPIALGAQPYPPALGDLDGDGHLDLVAPLVSSDAIAVLLGDGAGGFHAAPGSPVHTGRARPYALALLDLDHDGALDSAAALDPDTTPLPHSRKGASPRAPYSLASGASQAHGVGSLRGCRIPLYRISSRAGLCASHRRRTRDRADSALGPLVAPAAFNTASRTERTTSRLSRSREVIVS